MGLEIERKFLIRDESWRQQVERSATMRQGYLTSDARCSVRVRVAGERGFLNIKSGTLGIQRSEFEYPIPAAEAEEMLDTLCEQPLLEKTRHFVRHGQPSLGDRRICRRQRRLDRGGGRIAASRRAVRAAGLAR